MRHVQTTYWLEPAGSHGVWGLDDYQFLPFVWGSAQLIGHGHIRPKSITNTEVLEGYANKYLYLGCIKFVLQVRDHRHRCVCQAVQVQQQPTGASRLHDAVMERAVLMGWSHLYGT